MASAWGPATDWYRNICARPALAVRTGHSCYVPEQRLLPPAEAVAVFDDWARRQRWFARLMLGQLGLSGDVPEAERRALVARFPFVGFRPRRDCSLAAAHSLTAPGDVGPMASKPRGRPRAAAGACAGDAAPGARVGAHAR